MSSHRTARLHPPLTALIGMLALAGCAGPGEVEVSPAVHHDLSAPLKLMPVAARSLERVEHEVKPIPRAFDRSTPALPAPVARAAPTLLMPAPSASFDGVGQGFTGPAGTFSVTSAPPDTNGDVGPSHYVQVVNADLAIFSKSGTAIYGPVPLNTLWSGFGGGCATSNDGDPVVLYDPIADRWLISQFAVSTQPYLECVAVSQTADPTGAWYRYAFSYGNVDFPDYPKLGVWPDAYYVTFNIFTNGTSYAGSRACAYDRARMLAGAAATQQCFSTSTSFGGLLPADLDGLRLPPAGAPNPMLALGATSATLAYWKFHVDWTTPANSTFTGPTTIAVPGFVEACAGGTCIPQSGGGSLDSLADRLMFRLAYRSFADGHQALVANHSVTAGSSTGVRWYELRIDGSNNPSLFQSGTYAPDASYRWMGSIAQDQAGNIALGFSLSSSTLKPAIHYTGRLVGDPAGQMAQGESSLIDGAGAQGSTLARWGDYSMMAVDPVDDCTFWYTTEYVPANGTFNWRTRIGSFRFPGCGLAADFTIGASPGTLTVLPGGAGTSAISTAQLGGAGAVALSASVSPAGAGVTASLDQASVAAGGGATLTVSAAVSAAAGSYTVTVTGTEGPASHQATVVVTVPAGDFGLVAAPTSISIAQGASGTSGLSTAQVGSPGTVALSAAVSPAGAGVSATVSPASVAAGAGATLTVTAAPAAAPGSYTVTVSGVEGPASHQATVAVTVTAAPDFTIAAAPSSLSIPRGTSGTSAISTAQVALPGTVVLTVAVSPAGAGVTASLDRASIAAGAGATLTVSAAASAAPGSYAVTVTGAEGVFTHQASVAVAVPAPDFTLAASPPSLGLLQGAAAVTALSTGQVGSAGTVALSASVTPAGAGVTASVSPTSVAAGAGATLTVTASPSAAPGSYTVDVAGTEGTSAHGLAVPVSVTAAPDFGITVLPASLTVPQGGSGGAAVGTTALVGSGSVTLSVAVSPAGAGVTASVGPASVPAGGGAALTVTASAAAVPGSYTVTVTGTEGIFAHQAAVAVTVPPTDFSLLASPGALAVLRGSSATSALSTTQVGSPGVVGLSASVSPAGAGLSASVSPSTVAAGGGATLAVSASASATPGSYTVTVNGIEGGAAHQLSVAVTVAAPDFTLAASPAALSLEQGTSGTAALSTAQVGSPGAVGLSALVSPASPEVTASIDLASVAAGAGATLTVTAGAAAAPGSYTVIVIGSGEGATHQATVDLRVTAAPDFALAAPAALSVEQGGAANGTVTSTALVGSGTVALSAAVTPAGAGLTAALAPAAVAAGGGTSLLTVSASLAAAPGSYAVELTGAEGIHTHRASVAVTVTAAPDFGIAAAPATLLLAPGASATSAVSTAALVGSGTVALAVAVAPAGAGVTASLADAALPAGSGTTLTVGAAAGAAPGSYAVTVTGTQGLRAHQAAVVATVAVAPAAAAPRGGGCGCGAGGGDPLSLLPFGLLLGTLRLRRRSAPARADPGGPGRL